MNDHCCAESFEFAIIEPAFLSLKGGHYDSFRRGSSELWRLNTEVFPRTIILVGFQGHKS